MYCPSPIERLYHVEVLQNFLSRVVSLVLEVHFCHLVHLLREFSDHTGFEKLCLGSRVAHMTADMFPEGFVFRHRCLVHCSHLLPILGLIFSRPDAVISRLVNSGFWLERCPGKPEVIDGNQRSKLLALQFA